jgi:hypothetical protein
MTVSRTSPFNAAPRIDAQGFHDLFAAGASRDVRAERGIDEYYAAIVAEGCDPLLVAAIFQHESGMASNPQAVVNRYGTHNPGNLRSETYRSTGTVETDRGEFQSYADWLDGFAACAHHIAGPLYAGLTFEQAVYRWAPPGDGGNSPEAYLAGTLDFINAHATLSGEGRNMRVVVQSGHWNIEHITDDHLAAGSARTLSRESGSLGRETELTIPVGTAVVNLLDQCGFDAVGVDACYTLEWAEDAALALAIHGDGVGFGNDRPQWCSMATVHSGPSTEAVDEVADGFVAVLASVYPAVTGLAANGPVTDGMTQYYGGWYRTADTPMVLIETAIFGGSDGKRTDIPDVNTIAAAIAVAVCKWAVGEGMNVSEFATTLAASVGIGLVAGDAGTPHPPRGGDDGSDDPGAPRYFAETNQTIANGFRRYYEKHGDIGRFGYPLTPEFGYIEDGETKTILVCQRAALEWHPDLPSDDPDFGVRERLTGREWLRDLSSRGVAPSGAWLW